MNKYIKKKLILIVLAISSILNCTIGNIEIDGIHKIPTKVEAAANIVLNGIFNKKENDLAYSLYGKAKWEVFEASDGTYFLSVGYGLNDEGETDAVYVSDWSKFWEENIPEEVRKQITYIQFYGVTENLDNFVVKFPNVQSVVVFLENNKDTSYGTESLSMNNFAYNLKKLNKVNIVTLGKYTLHATMDSAFSWCENLESVKTTSKFNIKQAKGTFLGCHSLIKVDLYKDSVTKDIFDRNTFYLCPSLMTINGNSESQNLAEYIKDKFGCIHQYEKTINFNKSATCTANGIQYYRCINCGCTYYKSTPKLEHTWDEGVITKQATCAEEGITTYTCINCNETKSKAIPQIATHNWGEWIITKEATKYEEGINTSTCIICGETKRESITKISESSDNEKIILTDEITDKSNKNAIINKDYSKDLKDEKVSQEYISKNLSDNLKDSNKTATLSDNNVNLANNNLTNTNSTVNNIVNKPANTTNEVETLTVNNVSGLKLKNKKKSIKLSWKKVNDALEYKIQLSTKKSMKKAKVYITQKTHYTIKNLKKGTYYIRVKALNDKACSKWTGLKKIKIK